MKLPPPSRSFLIHVLTVMLVVLIAAGAAGAQPVSESAKGYLGEPRTRYRVFIFGDSLAAGLWSGMTRMGRTDSRISFNGRFKAGSGLVRKRYYDWVRALPIILKRNRVDIAVVSIGLNDARPLATAQGLLAFRSPQWEKAYTERVERFARIFKDAGVAVYWLAIPPIADPQRDAALKYVTGIHRRVLQEMAMRYIDTRKVLANDDDTYSAKGFDVTGQFRTLRARDGIHFLKSGNDKLASVVLDSIRKDIEVADGALDPQEAPVVGAPKIEQPSGETPLFGQAGLDEVAEILPRAELPRIGAVAIADANQLATALTARGVVARLLAGSARDSAAARLFRSGQWPAPPRGRVDDFSYSPQTAE